ncbi:hypothetical protein BpHYR1_036267 [Brachionus plicatilis]|uniref:Uncharacterized protein n=1 Tax=Brachionus plicatilis TaxID=10195 RepID=A0A3M7PJL8_BRAPC|nr:hypothetical protein BpHYR1_036267 [Brachionus plicatilis]
MNDTERDYLHKDLPSLLNMLESKNNATGRRTIMHRIIIVGRLNKNFEDKKKIGEHYEIMFRNQQQQQNNQKNPNFFYEKATGIIIIYPSLFVHVIESSSETIKDILKDMRKMMDDPEGMVTDARILNMAHEVHIRMFPVYTFKLMNLSLEHDSSEPSESLETLVNDMVIKLLRMGKYLNDQSKGQLKKEIIENLHEHHPEFFPNQNHANYLVKNQELMSPNEYLSFYEKPLNIIIDSDLTWPAPSRMFPFN